MCDCKTKLRDGYHNTFIMRVDNCHEFRQDTYPLPSDEGGRELQYQRAVTFARVHTLGYLRGNRDWYKYVSQVEYTVWLYACEKCNLWITTTPTLNDSDDFHAIPTGFCVHF